LPTVVSGNNASGVLILSGQNNTIVGTKIGVNAAGLLPLGNGAAGVYIVNSSNNTIGGKVTGAGNTIAYNNSQGVLVQHGTGNTISRNSIYNNGTLGIELMSGANNNQVAPVISLVRAVGQKVFITGTLTSTKNKSFTIELFASAANDGSGQLFLGSVKVKTDKHGLAKFTFTGTLPVLGGTIYYTSTATDTKGNTSELSAGVS
jgi:hypothetical protein